MGLTNKDSSSELVLAKRIEEIISNSHEYESKIVLKELKSDPLTGLSVLDAHERLLRFGPNALPEQERTSLLSLVIAQFEDRLVQMLLVASLISFILACMEEVGEARLSAFVEPAVILLILIANAVVGVVQESGAEKAIEVSFTSV